MGSWFFDATTHWAGRTALRLPGRGGALTFSQLAESARQTALPPKRTVATQMPESPEHVMILLAAMAAKRPFCPLSPRLPPARAAELARRAGAEVLLTPDRPLRVDEPAPAELLPGDSVIFTSGSSGEPKAVVISLSAHLASARGAAPVLGLEPGDSWALTLPLHHVSGLSILYRCLEAGAAVDLGAQDARPTHVSLVATQLKRRLAAGTGWAGLKAALVGGGPAGLDMVNAAVAAGCPLHLTYGMTETASQLTTTPRLTEALDHVHAGKPLPGRRVVIAEDGMIHAGGDVLARGFLEADGSVRPLAAGYAGLYPTGDLGRWDEEGNLVVTGRADRMFISGGENIHPEEIERALMALPGVEAAAVVPRDDPEFGRRPVAFVLGAAPPARLRAALAESLPGFLCPDEILPWPPGVPVPAGKIGKAALDRLAESFCDARKSR